MADPVTLGDYQIIELVRRGQSADAFLAQNVRMRATRVLLRVLHDDAAADEAFLRQFVEEAKRAARLENDCIASVIDLESETRPVYTVLEFIEGIDLGQMIQSMGPVPAEVACSIMVEVCRGMDYAHGASVLHRRLRPRMIKVTPEGHVKILGFGVLERQSVILPTVVESGLDELFRSPEQVLEAPEGPASDIYSLGVILFEMLSGQLPYKSIADYVAGSADRMPPNLRDFNPLVPSRLAALVGKMMAWRAADRPAGAAEVRRELDGILDERGDTAGPDLLRAFLLDPMGYATAARRRALGDLTERVRRLSRGRLDERTAAIHEARYILAAEPGHAEVKALLNRLQPATPALEDAPTQILPPAERVGPLAPKSPPKPGTGPAPKLAWIALVVAVAGAASWWAWPRRHEPKPSPETAAVPPVRSDSTGTLDVSTLPSGARVAFAHPDVVFTSDSVLATVPVGRHSLHVEKSGYRSRDTSITVLAGTKAKLVVDLELVPQVETPAACSLYVKVSPRADRVTVSVDDRPARGGPTLFAASVTPGKHWVAVHADSFESALDRVVVPHQPRTFASVTLVRKAPDHPKPPPPAPPAQVAEHAGTSAKTEPLEISVTPESDVFVDKVKVATHVGHKTIDLPVGTHEVRVENPNFVAVSHQFKVREGAKLPRYSVDLTVGEGGLYVTGPRQGLKIFVDDHFSGHYTPDRIVVSAGSHTISVRESDGAAAVGSQHVIVDPQASGNTKVQFAP